MLRNPTSTSCSFMFRVFFVPLLQNPCRGPYNFPGMNQYLSCVLPIYILRGGQDRIRTYILFISPALYPHDSLMKYCLYDLSTSRYDLDPKPAWMNALLRKFYCYCEHLYQTLKSMAYQRYGTDTRLNTVHTTSDL